MVSEIFPVPVGGKLWLVSFPVAVGGDCDWHICLCSFSCLLLADAVTHWLKWWDFYLWHNITITGPPNGPMLFCWLASVVVCNAAGVRDGRPSGSWTVGTPAARRVGVRRPTLHGATVGLRPVRATPCYYDSIALMGLCRFCTRIYNAMVTSVLWLY